MFFLNLVFGSCELKGEWPKCPLPFFYTSIVKAGQAITLDFEPGFGFGG